MAEPERRRRRLRPPSSVSVADETPATEATPEPVAAQPLAVQPAAVQPAAVQPAAVQPAAVQPAAVQPVAVQPVVNAPRPGPPSSGETIPVETAAIEDPAAVKPGGRLPARDNRLRPPAGGDEAERGLRGLVGSGSSQVSVDAALRARDAARPTEAQLADAEQNLPIIRRNWMPREDLPRNN